MQLHQVFQLVPNKHRHKVTLQTVTQRRLLVFRETDIRHIEGVHTGVTYLSFSSLRFPILNFSEHFQSHRTIQYPQYQHYCFKYIVEQMTGETILIILTGKLPGIKNRKAIQSYLKLDASSFNFHVRLQFVDEGNDPSL